MSADWNRWLYLLLNAFTLAGPLARSFEPRVRFSARWFALFPAVGLTAAGFLIWDVWFTKVGVWGFNSRYLVGPHLFGLPMEEWLFFLTVPYACLFIYDCLNYFFPIGSARWPGRLAGTTSVLALALAGMHWDKLYTSITCGLSGVCMAWAWYRRPAYLASFFRMYFVSLVPFFVVNGVLTGGATPEPVVWYSEQQIVGIRLGTIPLEDSFYLLPLLWLVTAQYEAILARKSPANASMDSTLHTSR